MEGDDYCAKVERQRDQLLDALKELREFSESLMFDLGWMTADVVEQLAGVDAIIATIEQRANGVESRVADEDDLAWVEDYVRQQTEKQAWRGFAGGIDGSGFGVDATIATVERPNEI